MANRNGADDVARMHAPMTDLPAREPGAANPGLRRLDLESNRVRRALEGTPLAAHLLSEETLDATLQETLASPHRTPDVWLFAYGSLVWNPVLDFDARVVATVRGYHRSFCLWSRINRGTLEQPGLVLGLDRGGCCPGIAYRIPARLAEGELRLLWRREMLLGSYAPRWVHTSQGNRSFRALAFVVNRHRSGYAGRLPPERIVDILRRGNGKFGNGIDYLRQTVDGLTAAGIRDPRLHELDAIARAASGADLPPGAHLKPQL